MARSTKSNSSKKTNTSQNINNQNKLNLGSLAKKLNDAKREITNSITDAVNAAVKNGAKVTNLKTNTKNSNNETKTKTEEVKHEERARRNYKWNHSGSVVLFIGDKDVGYESVTNNDLEKGAGEQASYRLSMPTGFINPAFGYNEIPRNYDQYSRMEYMNYATLRGDDFIDQLDYSDEKRSRIKVSLDSTINKLNRSINLKYTGNTEHYFRRSARWYNRFKLPNLDSVLSRGFAHVFFVRPSCNIFDKFSGDWNATTLTKSLQALDLFTYIFNTSQTVLKELTQWGGQSNDFMLSLSNAVQGFSLQDEVLDSDSYGKTYTGYKIAFGRHNLESRTASTLQLSFRDDRNLHIYQIIKAWTEYIAGVYRGYITPRIEDIFNKVLDYTGAIYYVITAEDGETVLFWSKYYGVFPTSTPSTQFNWGAGNNIMPRDIDVNFAYSYKEDFNPFQILEFNYNARCDGGYKGYAPIYDKEAGQIGATWVGTPFITSELLSSNGVDRDRPYCFKLRYMPNNDKEDNAFDNFNRKRKTKRGINVSGKGKVDKKYEKYVANKEIDIKPSANPAGFVSGYMEFKGNNRGTAQPNQKSSDYYDVGPGGKPLSNRAYKYEHNKYILKDGNTSVTTIIEDGSNGSPGKRTNGEIAKIVRQLLVSLYKTIGSGRASTAKEVTKNLSKIFKEEKKNPYDTGIPNLKGSAATLVAIVIAMQEDYLKKSKDKNKYPDIDRMFSAVYDLNAMYKVYSYPGVNADTIYDKNKSEFEKRKASWQREKDNYKPNDRPVYTPDSNGKYSGNNPLLQGKERGGGSSYSWADIFNTIFNLLGCSTTLAELKAECKRLNRTPEETNQIIAEYRKKGWLKK